MKGYHNIMSTLTDRQASMYLTSAQHAIGAAAATVPALARDLEGDMTAFASALGDFDRAAAEVARDTRLSPEGKRERHRDLAEAFATATESVPARMRDRLDSATRDLEAKVKPVPLHPDESVTEAKLMGARADARMSLDARPTTVLPTEMQKLAEREAGPVRHLLLTTTWGHRYLESRDARGGIVEWDALQRRSLPLVLDDAGKQAHASLETARRLASIPHQLHATREHAIRSRR
jgi:hypothetical protein